MDHPTPHRPVGNRSDFATCYRPSRWAEDVARHALCDHPEFHAVAYGFSAEGTVDAGLYQSTETHGKRPDLIVYAKDVYAELVKTYGKSFMESLDTTPDNKIPLECIKRAICAIEIEWSKGDGALMAQAAQIKKKASADKYQGIELVKGTELVTYIKAPDLKLLKQWQTFSELPIFVGQFYSDGYNRLFDLAQIDKEIREREGIIKSERIKYSSKEKMMTRYKVPYTMGITFANCEKKPLADAERIVKDNGRVDIVETVEGGTFTLTDLAVKNLTGEKKINKAQASSPLRASSELERLIMSKWIKASGTPGPEIYAKMKTFSREATQTALRDAVEDGMLKRTQTNGFTCYARS